MLTAGAGNGLNKCSSLGDLSHGLSYLVSCCTEAHIQLEFLVLSHGRAQPSPSVASPVSILLRCPDLCHGLLLLVSGLPKPLGEAVFWSHTPCM